MALHNITEPTETLKKQAQVFIENFTLFAFQTLNKHLNKSGLCISIAKIPDDFLPCKDCGDPVTEHSIRGQMILGERTQLCRKCFKRRLNHRVCRQCGAEIFDHGPLCDTCADVKMESDYKD